MYILSQQQFPEQEYAKPAASKVDDDDAEDKEIEEFCSSLKSQVEIFVNRMKSNSSRYGVEIPADPVTIKINNCHVASVHCTVMEEGRVYTVVSTIDQFDL